MPSCSKCLCTALLFWIACQAHAQAGPPMVTDDPGTPGDRRWEINLAAIGAHTWESSGFDLPRIDLNYGIGDRVQLKFEVPWHIDRVPNASPAGIGDPQLGVKWRFHDDGDAGWLISSYPQLTVHRNGGAAGAQASPHTSTLLPVEFERGLGHYDLTLEVGRWLQPLPQASSWIAGAVLGRDVGKGVEGMLELHAEGDQSWHQAEILMSVGVRVDLSDRYTLLASAGRDLRNTLAVLQDRMAYCGLQLHL